jgi:hypothetical protein
MHSMRSTHWRLHFRMLASAIDRAVDGVRRAVCEDGRSARLSAPT